MATVPKSGTPEKSSAAPPAARAGDARIAEPQAAGVQVHARRRLLVGAAAVLAVR